MKNINKKFICMIFFLSILIVPTKAVIQPPRQATPLPMFIEDFDPLNEKIIVTVTVNEIRALKRIDILSKPDFYLKVTINDKEFISDIWENMMYVDNMNWSASNEVPKDKEFVTITIALWDKNTNFDRLCDLSPNDNWNYAQRYIAELTYSIATGVWWGDDFLGDPSGYGRLNGCDDSSIYQQDRDCELWFDISQNDYDGDNLPYWLETSLYHTDPLINNCGEDADGDGIPIEWEHKFGLPYFQSGLDQGYYVEFDPFLAENHSIMDYDDDGLNNIEEYMTWQWGSDPFRRDLFIEIDQMEKGPNGEGSFVPIESYDLIRDAHAKYNIVWHIDDGRLGGGELIPYKEVLENDDLSDWYWMYFMHQDVANWRRGVFRWGIISYNWSWAKGFCFSSNINGSYARDCFFLSTKYHDMRAEYYLILGGLHATILNEEMNRAYVYAGGIMHETGHTLNLHAPGVDAHRTVWPWQLNYWRFAHYKSCMNYRYVYRGIVDYSDGSHGRNDFNDWATIDLTKFNPRATEGFAYQS